MVFFMWVLMETLINYMPLNNNFRRDNYETRKTSYDANNTVTANLICFFSIIITYQRALHENQKR